MRLANLIKSSKTAEWIFQITLFTIVFLFFSFDKDEPSIGIEEFAFFANYAIAVLIINYLLLPKLFYRKKYLYFLMAILVVIALVIAVEEGVLERIYYPDTRGRYFPGITFSLLDVMPVIMILFGMKFGWDIIRKQQEVEDLKAHAQQSELSFLKSQINPHFLFNNLNNLYSYALENSPKTPAIILELSSVLRYMLYECRDEYVPLRNELNQLQNFVQLSELQVEERGEIKFNYAEQCDPSLKIAPLILMVFVENAFKHSMASLSEKIVIEINIEVSDRGELDFRCVNSYESEANNEKLDQGIGLENVQKRLELIYPEKHSLAIKQEADLFSVQLKIDLK